MFLEKDFTDKVSFNASPEERWTIDSFLNTS